MSSSQNHDAENTASGARHLIFVRKKWTGATGWSDAIDKFYAGAAPLFDSSERVEISVRGFRALRQSRKTLLQAAASTASKTVIMVNHSICWWALAPTLMKLKRRGATICLCMHEHEQILGLSFALKNFLEIPAKELLRYCRLFHRIPAMLSSRVLVLTDAQASVLKIADPIRTSYLPVDARLFPPQLHASRESNAAVLVLFAHDPGRFDKGHRFVEPARRLVRNEIRIVYGRDANLPFDQVYTKYWACDVLFLPSDWESYSLVFIEALACNKFAVVSARVGALRLLLAKYSAEDLEALGVYVSHHDAAAYARALDAAADRVKRGELPATRSLFEEFGFDQAKVPAMLI